MDQWQISHPVAPHRRLPITVARDDIPSAKRENQVAGLTGDDSQGRSLRNSPSAENRQMPNFPTKCTFASRSTNFVTRGSRRNSSTSARRFRDEIRQKPKNDEGEPSSTADFVTSARISSFGEFREDHAGDEIRRLIAVPPPDSRQARRIS